MQQIIYDIIDNCFAYNNKNNSIENNSANSDMTNTPPQSTKSTSCNSHLVCQKENKKIFFNVLKNYKINIINNNENNNINNLNINNNNYNNKNIFINKKRKRIFAIKKIQRKNDSTKKIFKKINIFKQQFQLPKIHQEKKIDNIDVDILIDKKTINNKKIFNNITNNIINNNNKSNKNKVNENKSNEDKIKEIGKDTKTSENNDKEIKDKNENNENKKKKKKTSAQNEKELQLMYEQKFLENINKEYPDKEYEKDMINISKDKKLKFMKDNFPMMFRKDKFYLYYILPKRRKSSKEYFISPDYFSINYNHKLFNNNSILYINYDLDYKNNGLNNNIYISLSDDFNKYIGRNRKKKNNFCNKIFNIIKTKKNKVADNIDKKIKKIYNNTDLVIKEKYSFIPKKIWSLNNQKINVEKFFDDCIQIWPFDECCFVKEIALEFLMKNNYDMEICLKKKKEFVYFMKKRAEELDFPIISESIKTIKKYNLRKTNYN